MLVLLLLLWAIRLFLYVLKPLVHFAPNLVLVEMLFSLGLSLFGIQRQSSHDFFAKTYKSEFSDDSTLLLLNNAIFCLEKLVQFQKKRESVFE